MNIPFIKYSKVLIFFSCAVTIVSLWSLVTWGLKLGIDFTGGSMMELDFAKNRPATEEIQAALKKVEINNVSVQKTGDSGLLIRLPELDETQHQQAVKAVREAFEKDGNTIIENRFEMIGPSVSNQLRQRSLWAIILVCLGIIIYIGYAFRMVSRPIASWKYGLLAVIATFHDVILVVGVFAFLGHFREVEVDVAFVVAALTVLGFSVHDTIVVYDRIREKLLHRASESFAEVVNAGLNQTLARSINTTLATMLPLFALFMFGGKTIHAFTLALLIGIASGAYSSIFIASPLLVYVERWQQKGKKIK